MPIKLTWKDGLAALVTLAGFVLPWVTTEVSHLQGGLATVGGIVVVGLARLAEAKDYATTGGVDVSRLSAAVAASSKEIVDVKAQAAADVATAKAQAGADYDTVKAQVISDLGALITNGGAVAGLPPVSTSVPTPTTEGPPTHV